MIPDKNAPETSQLQGRFRMLNEWTCAAVILKLLPPEALHLMTRFHKQARRQ
jgi:hypothetical protein